MTSVILYIYSGYVTASEYYVSAAPNGVPCLPIYQIYHKTHNLSYYASDYMSFFTKDAIFSLEGAHTLQGTLNISNVNNITLKRLGHIEQGSHETIMQSTSVIRCSDNNRAGIAFINNRNVVIKSLTIANSGFDTYISGIQINVSLSIIDINNITLKWLLTTSVKYCFSVSGICSILWYYILSCLASSVKVSLAKTNY